MKGRLLDLTLGDPYSNLAFEEALLRTALVPTLRVWRNQKSVVLGRAQLAEFETDVTYCRRSSIPIVRRMTAGGAVYNGPGNLNWTFCVQKGWGGDDFRGTLDAKRVFSRFASMVVAALGDCGVKASFSPPNSIEAGSGKVSGMAAFVSREATICHGTLLVSADLDEVQRLTKPSDSTIGRRYPRSRHVAVANCAVDETDFIEALSRSGDGFHGGTATYAEKAMARSLEEKYRSERWNLGDPFE